MYINLQRTRVDSISTTDYNQFLSQFPLRHYPKGRMLIASHEEPNCIFYLEMGKVRKYDVTKYGEQVVINIFKAPNLLPLSWVLNKTPNQYYYEASTRLVVRCIPTEALSAYLLTHPAIVYDLLQQVYEGLENSQRRVVYLTRGTARTKLLFELLIEARRSGEAQSDGTILVSINETELAERAGLSRETISRALTKICKTTDICQRKGRSIVVKSLDELSDMLDRLT